MKGLLVKDVCILKMQKNVLLILLAMLCGVYCFFGKSDVYCESDAHVRLHRCLGNIEL